MVFFYSRNARKQKICKIFSCFANFDKCHWFDCNIINQSGYRKLNNKITIERNIICSFLYILLVLLSNLNIILYFRNLRYAHLTPIFYYTIPIKYSLPAHTYIQILCTEKPFFLCKNMNNLLICFEKNDKYVFKG